MTNLFSGHTASLNAAIERSVAENIVLSWVGDQKESIVDALLLLTASIALKRCIELAGWPSPRPVFR